VGNLPEFYGVWTLRKSELKFQQAPLGKDLQHNHGDDRMQKSLCIASASHEAINGILGAYSPAAFYEHT
jgi:hypothetical protein